MKKIIFSSALILSAIFAFAQNNRHWGTYYGGSRSDNGYSVAHDNFGNIYIAGSTNDTATNPAIIPASGFQNTYGGGNNDGFLAKFDSSGTRLWATYYGGNGDDRAYAVTTDAAGNVYLAGITTSTDSNRIWQGGMVSSFQGGTYDGFLAKFDANGGRLWGTYYGKNFSCYPQNLAIDISGDVYMAGYASDTGGITTAGSHQPLNGGGTYDAFLVKFNPGGVRLWGTYYGGSGNDGANPAGAGTANADVAVDAAGNVYLSGLTASTNGIASSNGVHQPVYGTNTDAYLAKFDSNGNRIWGTYYGGAGGDQGHSVAVLGNNLYLSGRTASASGIASAGAYQTVNGGGTFDSFLARFDTSGTRIWGTYYGDAVQEWGLSVTTDGAGNIYQAGRSSSTANIASADGFQTAMGGTIDAYVVKFDTAGTRYCATYLGGGGNNGDFGYGVTLNQGKIYMVGLTNSNNGMASAGSHDDTYGGNNFNDAFLAKFSSCIYDSLQSTDATCGGTCDGTATAFGIGGTKAPYTYMWNTVPAQNTQTATGLCAGTYTVTVWDAWGNYTMDSVTISEPTPISITTFSNPATCGNSDGSAGANATNGTSPYTYVWNPTAQTSQAATGLAAGIYTVTVTDANGCTSDTTVVVNNSSTLSASVTSQSDVTCFGGNDGSATVTASFGNPSYTYSWSPVGGTNATANGLTAGNYNCTVSDASGCQVIVPVTINEPAQLVATMSANAAICAGDSASISVTASGGTGAYTYVWVPSTGLNDNTISNPMASPAGTTTYSVLVTDANNCTTINSLVVTVNTVPVASISGGNSTVCSGTNIALTASGGGTYLWNTGATTAVINDSLTTTTSYTVIVSSGACSDTAITTVTVTNPPSTSVSTVDATCGNNDGSADVTATGGNPPYTYLWSDGQTTSSATGLGVGVYNVTVADASGCTASDTATVNNNSTLSASVTSQTDVTCFGGTDGTADVTATLGNPAYTYSWQPSGGSSSAATGLSAGTYTCTVTDANNCVVFVTVNINEPAQLTSTTSGNTAICGDSAMISVTPSGGTGAYTYVWVPSTGLNNNAISNPVATPTATQTYSVLITDANGCTNVNGLTVSVTTPPVASVSGDTTVCTGSSSTLTATGGTSYLWSTTATTASIVISPTANATYTVIVSNGGNCNDTATISVTVGSSPNVTVITNDATCGTCPDGSATAFASGGTQPYTYSWSPSGQSTLTATGLTPGMYTVCVTDANGCSKCDSAQVNFTIAVAPELNLSSISIYPNPFSATTSVVIPEMNNHNCELRIYDMIGNEMRAEISRKPNGFVVSRENLKQGIYFLKIIADGKIVGTRKLIVE